MLEFYGYSFLRRCNLKTIIILDLWDTWKHIKCVIFDQVGREKGVVQILIHNI
jgi:hypothetical protein